MAQAQLDLQAAMAGSLPEGPFNSSPTMEPLLEDDTFKNEKKEDLSTPTGSKQESRIKDSVVNGTTLGKRRPGRKRPACPDECNDHETCPPSQPASPQKPHVVFERFRRSRLSRTVAEIAKCVPLSNPKHDKATVLEAAVLYLEYFHENVGNIEQFDAEFLLHLNNGPFSTTSTDNSNSASSDQTQQSSTFHCSSSAESKSESSKNEEKTESRTPVALADIAVSSAKPAPKRKRPSAKPTIEKSAVSIAANHTAIPNDLSTVPPSTTPKKQSPRKRPAKKSKTSLVENTSLVVEQQASCSVPADFIDTETTTAAESLQVPVAEPAVPVSDSQAAESLESLPQSITAEDLSLKPQETVDLHARAGPVFDLNSLSVPV